VLFVLTLTKIIVLHKTGAACWQMAFWFNVSPLGTTNVLIPTYIRTSRITTRLK